MQIDHPAQQAGNISPGEAQRFAEADQRLRRYASQPGRDGLSLGECEASGRQIAEMAQRMTRLAQRQLVERLAGTRPGVSSR